MSIRIQVRRDTQDNWYTNNPLIYPGEMAWETDTNKFKIGPAVSAPYVGTAWRDITAYANVPQDLLNSTLDGYLQVTDLGDPQGPAQLDVDGNLLVPYTSIIIEGATNDSYTLTLEATDPTDNRVITIPDADGIIALQSYVDDAIAAFDALPTQTGNNGKFLQTNGSSTQWATVDLSTKQDKVTGVSDTEIGYLDGVTSAIQTQINSKLASSTASSTYAPIANPTFTGTVAGISKSMVGLGSVDNTSDANKPISTATQSALDEKASKTYVDGLASNYDGFGSAATAESNAKSYADQKITDLIDGAGPALDTLNELAAAINDDASYAATISTALGYKAPLESPTFTGTVTLPSNTISNAMMKDDSVDTAEIKNSAVTNDKLAGSIALSKLATDPLARANHTGSQTASTISNFNEAAQDAVGGILGTGLIYNDSTNSIGVNHAEMTTIIIEGASGNSYGLVGTSTYLDVKDTNGYNKEIELDIAAVESQLDTDGYITESSTSTLTNKTLTSPKINEAVELTATSTELNTLDGITASTTELNYVDGVTSAIQDQLDDKAPLNSPVFTGGISVTDGAGIVAEGDLLIGGNADINGNLTVYGTTVTVNTANVSLADNMIYLNEAIHYDITDASGDGTHQTYTTSVNHGLSTSMVARITGMNPSGYNKSSYVAITAVTADTFTVAGTEVGTFIAGGTVYGKSAVNPDLGLAGGYNDGTYHHAGMFRDASDGKWKFFQGYEPEPDGPFINTSDASFELAPLKVAGFEADSITVGDVSNTEFGYLNGVTSAIQTQLDAKVNTNNPSFSVESSSESLINYSTNGYFDDSSFDTGTYSSGSATLVSYNNTSKVITLTVSHYEEPDQVIVANNASGAITNKTGLYSPGPGESSLSISSNGNTRTIAIDLSTVPNINISDVENIVFLVRKGSLSVAKPFSYDLSSTSLTISSSEISYLDGVTSSIQTQIDAKQAIVSGVSNTEIGYLDGVTSAIQTQLNAKASSTDLSNHASDTTSIHGIADTSLLATTSYVDTAIGNIPDGFITSIDPYATSLYVTDGALSIDGYTLFSAWTKPNGGIVLDGPSGIMVDTDIIAPIDSPALTGDATAVNLTVSGNLTVNGTTTNINSTNLVIEDKNIVLGDVATPSNVTANGGGITLNGDTNKTFNWINSTSAWTSSEHIDLASGKVLKIGGTQVLSATNYAGTAATVTNGVYTTGSYSNPSWITGLGWSKISSTPTTLSGYGITDAQSKVSGVSDTEIGYLDGVTSGIQTQLDGKAPSDVIPAISSGGVTPVTFSNGTTSATVYVEGNFIGYTDGTWNSTTLAALNAQVPVGSQVTIGYESEWGSTTFIVNALASLIYGAAGWTSFTYVSGDVDLAGTYADTVIASAGTAGQVLTNNGTVASWENIDLSSKQDVVSGVSSTEIGYLDGVTSAIQTQLDAKIAKSLVDAKGDILVGSADNTVTRLGVGTNGYLLTANSSATNGVEWAAAPVSLPSQSGNNGKYLTTDGTDASWATLSVPISTGTYSLTGNTATTVDATTLSTFTSIEYMVSLKQGSKIRTSKVILQTDGTNVDMTEYAITETGGSMAGVAISATTAIATADLQVTVTNASSTNVTVKFSKVAL